MSPILKTLKKPAEPEEVVVSIDSVADYLDKDEINVEFVVTHVGSSKYYVFLNPQGNVLRWNYIQNELTNVTKEAGLPRLTMHALRHTFATRCIEAGMRPKTLQVLLGHSSVDFTMNLYVHVTPEQKEKEVLRVEKNILCGAGEYYGT